MRLAVRAPADTTTGYGNDGVDLVLALAERDLDVVPYPSSIHPGLPPKYLTLLGKDGTKRPDVLLAFAPPFDLTPETTPKGIPTVGYTMWERLPLVAEDFAGHGWDRTEPGFEHLAGLAVTCEMNVAAFEPLAGSTPIVSVPCGINAARFPFAPRDRSGPTRFLMVGALGPRKNPFALLEVWRDLKAAEPSFDATLHLHTTAVGLHPGIVDAYGPGLTLSTGTVSSADLLAMYHAHDVLVAPSRGEGNNKPPMEFMATGGTVIASDWSGHQNWLHPDVATAVPGEVVQSPLGPLGTKDFEVDRAALGQALLVAAAQKARMVRMGEVAHAWIKDGFTWQRTVDGLMPLLTGQAS